MGEQKRNTRYPPLFTAPIKAQPEPGWLDFAGFLCPIHGLMKARAIDEDRAAHRRRVKQRAVVILRPGVETQCTVLDTSETGARLSFRSMVILPKRFRLYFVESGRETDVSVVWQKRTLAGVRYAERLREPKVRPGPVRRGWLTLLSHPVGRVTKAAAAELFREIRLRGSQRGRPAGRCNVGLKFQTDPLAPERVA
jgi:hypothetical protein